MTRSHLDVPAHANDSSHGRSRIGPLKIPGLELLREVGSGGHSTVYLARQVDHDRQVAVKVLDAALDRTARRRFDRERSTLGRVSTHPGVVGLFDSGITDDGRAYLVLEWAPGGSLEDHLVRVGTLSVDDTTALGICLAGALEQAHRSGVMHRDIKPGNIVRSAFGDWLLTDFSVAAFSDPAIATDAIHVSLAHCPPEAFDRIDPSAAADVYSLGSVLRTALVGDTPNAPLAGEAMTAAIGRISTVPLPVPDRRIAGDALSQLIGRMIALEPGHRPATMRSVAHALASVRRNLQLPPITFRVGQDLTLPPPESHEYHPMPRRTPTRPALPEPTIGVPRPPSQLRTRGRYMLRRAVSGVALVLTLFVGTFAALQTTGGTDVVTGLVIPAAAIAEPDLTSVGSITEGSATGDPISEEQQAGTELEIEADSDPLGAADEGDDVAESQQDGVEDPDRVADRGDRNGDGGRDRGRPQDGAGARDGRGRP